MDQYIIGKNSVYEALRSGKKLNVVLLSRRRSWDNSIREIMNLAKKSNIPVRQLDEDYFPAEVRKMSHQGVIAEGAPSDYVDIDEIYSLVENNQKAFILLIENVEDPQNLGALLRSAECAGVDGVVIPKNRACPVTSTVHHVSAGAAEHLKIARVANLNQVIEQFKKRGLWIYGLDAAGDKVYNELDLKGAVAVIIGGENKGLAQLTKKKCDFLVRIPLKGKVNSLNTSVAGALFMFEVSKQR